MFAGEVLVKTSIHERASILPRTDAHLHRRKGWQPRMAFEVNELMRVESLAWGSLRKATRRRGLEVRINLILPTPNHSIRLLFALKQTGADAWSLPEG